MSIHDALLDTAFELFLKEDYNKVTVRQIAERAETSTSMIQYYFGGKRQLYEGMVRQQFKRIGQVMQASYSEEHGLDFHKMFLGYLDVHQQHPDFPAFLINILAYKNGPGYMLLSQILDDKRDVIAGMISSCKEKGIFSQHVDVDVLRVTMMSLTVFPFLIKGVLEHSTKMTVDDAFLEKLAVLAGELMTHYSKF